MSTHHRAAAFVFVLVAVAGCASTTATLTDPYTDQRIPRPERIIVHDFAATADDIPPGSLAQQWAPSAPPSANELALGRQLGSQVAQDLVSEIEAMGLRALRPASNPPPRPGDIVIMGYFESINAGSAAKRIALGFGAGAAELRTAVEGYLMTDRGLRRLGEGVVESEGGKGPGVVAPLAVAIASGNPIGLAVGSAAKIEGQLSGRATIEGSAKRTAKKIADQLRVAFQRQGWI